MAQTEQMTEIDQAGVPFDDVMQEETENMQLAHDVAIAALQGMLACGYEVAAAAHNAWVVAVPAFFGGREAYLDLVEKLNTMGEGAAPMTLATEDQTGGV